MSATRKKLLLIIVPLEVIAAVLARRDLATRSDAEVRGSKRFWRVFVLLNPGNALLYWVLGRRARLWPSETLVVAPA
jgi:hypothetical protein